MDPPGTTIHSEVEHHHNSNSMMYTVSPVYSSDPSMTRTSCSSSSSPSSSWTSSSMSPPTSTNNVSMPSSHCAASVSEPEEQLAAMLVIEQSYKIQHIPCRLRLPHHPNSVLPHEEWRRKICEWCYKVVDHFRYDREVVSVAMNYFDRFLMVHTQENKAPGLSCHCPSCQRAVDSRTFQLSAMTSLYLAIKLHAESGNVDDGDYYFSSSRDSASHYAASSSPPPKKQRRHKKLKLSSFVDLSRGQFTPQDILHMERTMLSALSWKVNPTTPMTLCAHLLRCMPHESRLPYTCRRNYDLVLHVMNELSRYMTELSVCLANVSSVYLPSQVAYASILISMDMLTLEALPLEVRDEFCEVVAHACFEGNVSLVPSDETIAFLRERLRHSFLPEMLMEDDTSSEDQQQHPISIARDAGLLDLHYVAPLKQRRSSARSVADHDMEQSAACVSP